MTRNDQLYNKFKLSNSFNSLPNFEAKIITLPLNFIIYKLAFKKTLPKRQSKLL